MDQGLITNPKDLERMQHELESLERRITSLEDEELEVMEQLEEAAGRARPGSSAQVAEADERLAALAAARDEKLAALDERAGRAGRRARPGRRRAARRPARALRQAARAEGRRRRGRAARPPVRRLPARASTPPSWAGSAGCAEDEVVRCEECQRILVRTPESGL